MAEKSLKFLVVFFSKNKRLFQALGVLAIIVAVVGLTVTLTDWFPSGKGEAVPWTIVRQDGAWQGVPTDTRLPRFFVAGGVALDKEILVDGWGLPEELLTPVDYLEDLGIHVLMGEVTQVLYSPNKLHVYITEKDSGYQLVTIGKGNLSEGDLQITFVDADGTKVGYVEEFVHSIPLNYKLVDSGPANSKGAVFMEVLDGETLPALTEHSADLLKQYSGSLLLYIQGAKVATIQRNEAALRIYIDEDPGYQIVAVPTDLLQPGKNTVRLIDSNNLEVISQLVYQVGQ